MSENSNSFKFVFIMVATDMLKSLEEAFDEAWDLVNSEDGWKEEHKDKGTDTFFVQLQKVPIAVILEFKR